MQQPKFILKKTNDGQFHFVLEAANHEVIAQSETYKTEQGAKKGIVAIANAVVQMVNAHGTVLVEAEWGEEPKEEEATESMPKKQPSKILDMRGYPIKTSKEG